MTGWDDDRLLAALRQALYPRRAVPAEFVEAGKNAFAWRNVDAELAQLTYDSSYRPEAVASTRTESASIRALTFTSARLTIELEVTEDAVLGQVLPAQATAVEVEPRTGEHIQLASDEIGCFAIEAIPRGPFRLHCRAAGGIDVLTGWITL